MAAVMAREQTRGAVQHERDVALRTAPDPTAGAAGEEVRPAAAVEQDDRLAARAAHLGECLRGLGVQAVDLLAHVEHPDSRQRPPVDALGQAQARQPVHALRTWGRAAHQQQRALLACAPGGDIASVVAGVAFVLVGGVVLLVYHDQAEPLDRREHGRARSHADARLAGAQPAPLFAPLRGRQARMQHRHGVSEARDEASDDLGGQRDLRHEHDRTAALLEHTSWRTDRSPSCPSR